MKFWTKLQCVNIFHFSITTHALHFIKNVPWFLSCKMINSPAFLHPFVSKTRKNKHSNSSFIVNIHLFIYTDIPYYICYLCIWQRSFVHFHAEKKRCILCIEGHHEIQDKLHDEYANIQPQVTYDTVSFNFTGLWIKIWTKKIYNNCDKKLQWVRAYCVLIL